MPFTKQECKYKALLQTRPDSKPVLGTRGSFCFSVVTPEGDGVIILGRLLLTSERIASECYEQKLVSLFYKRWNRRFEDPS